MSEPGETPEQSRAGRLTAFETLLVIIILLVIAAVAGWYIILR